MIINIRNSLRRRELEIASRLLITNFSYQSFNNGEMVMKPLKNIFNTIFFVETTLLVIVSLLIILSGCTFPSKPTEPPEKPFASDGCSCWPDWDYYDCCYNHDKDYWWGGTPQERKESDLRLMKCISEKGHTVLPIFMYIGVRIGGHGWLPTPFRWGFGRPWPEGYYSEPKKAEE